MVATARKEIEAESKHVLLSPSDLPDGRYRLAIRSIDVGSWNGGKGTKVHVRELAASEIEIWQRVMQHVGGNPPLDDVLDYLMAAICTPDGRSIFTTEADREALRAQSLAVLFAIFTAAMNTATLSAASIAAEKKD